MGYKAGSNNILLPYLGTTPINKGYLGNINLNSGEAELYRNFDSSYRAILNYAALQGYSAPTISQQVLQNQLVLDLKAANIWTEMDFFYVFATNGSTGFSKINWVNPGTYQATEYGPVSFTPNQGWKGNGGEAIDTNYTPSFNWSGGTDVSMGAWMDLNGLDGTAIGSYSGTRTQIIHSAAGGAGTEYGIAMATGTNPNAGTVTQSDGLWVVDNTGGGSTRLFVNEATIATSGDGGSNTFSNVSISMLARKTSNTPSYDQYSTSRVKMGFFGSRTVGQNIYTPFNDYLNAI